MTRSYLLSRLLKFLVPLSFPVLEILSKNPFLLYSRTVLLFVGLLVRMPNLCKLVDRVVYSFIGLGVC